MRFLPSNLFTQALLLVLLFLFSALFGYKLTTDDSPHPVPPPPKTSVVLYDHNEPLYTEGTTRVGLDGK